MKALTATIAALLACAVARSAAASPIDDFAFEVKESIGDYTSPWVLTKLTTFKLGPKCFEKLADKEQSAIHFATFYTRDIVEYAKLVTGDDWLSIENQNDDRETNKKLVEPMMSSFRAKLSVTVIVEGNDCKADSNAMWLRYWTEIGSTLKAFPPRSGKAFVTLNVTSKAKDVSVTVDKTGSTFVITAPRDIEPQGWSDKLSKPFRKLAKPL